ncbi:phosphodiester glycosidase family protein [Paenibacillus sp. HWE-109]|uniref:phosphodiester glycosidase family protein n=1 Tax=Paenibacillus sp. HWE-109 TaxID=1306526 RepID=UPI001EE0F308|nr:phosphodiester glycosidase family protein [Paenibacillus sp. HWE-109]UKS25744.1 phosphodiester glycosidase family protein [Paenibacillus sp. HWE-109]
MAYPYTFTLREFNEFGAIYKYAVIKTEIGKAKPEIINTQMQQKPHIGINGGFFAADNGYSSPPTGIRSISYWNGDTTSYAYNGTSSAQYSRKTFVSYKDGTGVMRATHIYASNLNEVLANYPTAQAVIGGTDYNEDSWTGGLPGLPSYSIANWRTVLAWDSTSAYMIVTANRSVNIPTLKRHMETLGYNPTNSVILDGSGSTSMRVAQNDVINWYGSPTHDRYIGNMVRVYGIDFFG